MTCTEHENASIDRTYLSQDCPQSKSSPKTEISKRDEWAGQPNYSSTVKGWLFMQTYNAECTNTFDTRQNSKDVSTPQWTNTSHSFCECLHSNPALPRNLRPDEEGIKLHVWLERASVKGCLVLGTKFQVDIAWSNFKTWQHCHTNYLQRSL